MSITQPLHGTSPSGNLGCPNCNAALPSHATFCSSCGERIDTRKNEEQWIDNESEVDINTRYHITSLIRRRPYVNLFFAIDNQQSALGEQRMLAIRDIDITSLSDEVQTSAIEVVQREYDLLRRSSMPYVMPVIAFRYFQSHLFIITGWPFASSQLQSGEAGTKNTDIDQHLHTLQDLLQSGIGLPGEQVVLNWMNYLCHALDKLHSSQIVIGDLDPYTIILDRNSYDSRPALMVSWIPSQLRSLLPPTSAMTHMSYFTAPEALLGKPEPRSDIYSLGAIFYLLLTGMAPDMDLSAVQSEDIDEEPVSRPRHRLRSPKELNPRISSSMDECVMRALSIDPTDRFASARAMAIALLNPPAVVQSRSKLPKTPPTNTENSEEQDANVETVRIVPLSQKNLRRWQSSSSRQHIPNRPRLQTTTSQIEGPSISSLSSLPETSPEASEPTATSSTATSRERLSESTIQPVAEKEEEEQPRSNSKEIEERTELESPTGQAAGNTAIPQVKKPSLWQRIKGLLQRKVSPLQLTKEPLAEAETQQEETDTSFLKQIQRMLLGEQRHTITASVIIETPLRVQPNQEYNVRIHLIGRDEPGEQAALKRGTEPAGLSALVHGDQVIIEVRSALHHNYAYIVQQAAVTLPGRGYAAEVTIPMHPLPSGTGGRRDRLHIFFMDEQRRPLYEKPFVVELFVSSLVQFGREGHNVLTIPF